MKIEVISYAIPGVVSAVKATYWEMMAEIENLHDANGGSVDELLADLEALYQEFVTIRRALAVMLVDKQETHVSNARFYALMKDTEAEQFLDSWVLVHREQNMVEVEFESICKYLIHSLGPAKQINPEELHKDYEGTQPNVVDDSEMIEDQPDDEPTEVQEGKELVDAFLTRIENESDKELLRSMFRYHNIDSWTKSKDMKSRKLTMDNLIDEVKDGVLIVDEITRPDYVAMLLNYLIEEGYDLEEREYPAP